LFKHLRGRIVNRNFCSELRRSNCVNVVATMKAAADERSALAPIWSAKAGVFKGLLLINFLRPKRMVGSDAHASADQDGQLGTHEKVSGQVSGTQGGGLEAGSSCSFHFGHRIVWMP
jgi:hypothetical protein